MYFRVSILIIFSLLFSSDQQIITHFSDNDYNYVFRLTEKRISKTKNNKTYYWYKSNGLHYTKGGYGGKLLNGKFEKFYKSNQLAEKGLFVNGLKDNLWLCWFENGNIEEEINWKNGLKQGGYKKFNSNGKLIVIGKYRKGLKDNMWIDYIKKDTVYYDDGKMTDKPKSFIKKISLYMHKLLKKKNNNK